MSLFPKIRIAATVALTGGALLAGMAPLQAQQLKQTFINPSFGGNPFNSQHLQAIAEIGRPDAPEEAGPSNEELLALQIQSRLTSQLGAEIQSRIDNAKPGETGEFTLGDQIIRFVRTETEIRLTFVNGRTGVTNEFSVPVRQAATTPVPTTPQPGCQPGNPFCSAGASLSAEAVLSSKGPKASAFGLTTLGVDPLMSPPGL